MQMRALALLVITALLTVFVGTVSFAAQTNLPLVVFIEEPRDLAMSSVISTGVDGVSKLAQVFERYGAQTRWVRLREQDNLPPETAVIVLVRPRRELRADQLARIFERVHNGTNLLIAVDPIGLAAGRPERAIGGLARLLNADFGVALRDGILIEPWFTSANYSTVNALAALVQPDTVPHPIIAPLQRYDLPVVTWGARPVSAEFFGMNSTAHALLFGEPLFAETAIDIYPTRTNPNPPTPELNIGVDPQGRLHIAAVGENSVSGARIALLGDAELMQNGYGLAGELTNPTYVGNAIMTQNLVGWLLNVPEADWLPPPANFTYIALDGDPSDLPAEAQTTLLEDSGTSIPAQDLTEVRAIRNDAYVYLGMLTAAPPDPTSRVTLALDVTGNGVIDLTLQARDGQIVSIDADGALIDVIPDAGYAVGAGIELRVPLRVTGQNVRVLSLCVDATYRLAFPQTPGCFAGNLPLGSVLTPDPAPNRSLGEPVAVVIGIGSRVNLRAAPSTDANIVNSFAAGTLFTVTGRTARADWLRVHNAAWSGWISTTAVFFTADPEAIPIVG